MSIPVDVNKIWLVKSVYRSLRTYRRTLSKDDKHRRWLKRVGDSKRLDPERHFREMDCRLTKLLVDNLMLDPFLKFPPIILCKVGNNYRIVQGHFYLMSALLRGEETINAIFVQAMY